ncbi:hypothetical protein ACIF80_30735 [Streptomyces sp. NPDC085927]|uniref:hypothetical protein n=1 Tax=Streptomyces sp. NPDC085927 TaxID=3365738 RepID=UPI0037D068F1
MPHSTSDQAKLADEITRQLGHLTSTLVQLPAHQATQLIARVLDPMDGILSGFAHLVATGSRFAKNEAERGALPAEVWLALGRAANELNAIGVDLEEHADTLQRFSARPAATAAKPLVATPLVIRRRR